MEIGQAKDDIEEFCRKNYYQLLQPFNRDNQAHADYIRLINFYASMKIKFAEIDLQTVKGNINRISYQNKRYLDEIILLTEKKSEKVMLKNFQEAAKLRDLERDFWEENSASFHEDIFLERNCVGLYRGTLFVKPKLWDEFKHDFNFKS
jgi:hypothetical protein